MHLLSGQPEIETVTPAKSSYPVSQEIEELKVRVVALESELADMRSLLSAIGA